MNDFISKLESRWQQQTSVCVGLDTDWDKIPAHLKEKHPNRSQALFEFNKAIIDATCDLVCAYKLNSAFYEGEGLDGIKAMIDTVAYIKSKDSTIPVISDAKRADIGNTNKAYIKAFFNEYQFDAITVHPYLGREAIQPFLDEKDKGIIVLCRTSNPGASEIQDLSVDGQPVWEYIARKVIESWNSNSNCCLVVGATYPEEMKRIRTIASNMPFLIPGIGAQGGDLEATVKAGRMTNGHGMIINSSRGIIYASSDEDFAEAARRETQKMRDSINQYNKE